MHPVFHQTLTPPQVRVLKKSSIILYAYIPQEKPGMRNRGVWKIQEKLSLIPPLIVNLVMFSAM